MDEPGDGPTIDEARIVAALEQVDDELARYGSLVPVLRAHDAVGDDAMRFAVVRSLRTARSIAADTSDADGDGELPAAVRDAVPLLASQWILGCATALAARPPAAPVDTATFAGAARDLDAATSDGALPDGAVPDGAVPDGAAGDPQIVDVTVVRHLAADRAAVVVAAQRAAGGEVDAASAVGLAAAFVDGFMVGLRASHRTSTAT
jgi:hypothetical protein